MLYYKSSKQMDLSDRIAIETGICRGESFKRIAKRLNRHPSTIAHEIKENRTFIKGVYPCGKDCRYAETRNHQHKRALALTSRKFIRLLFGLLDKGQLYSPEKSR